MMFWAASLKQGLAAAVGGRSMAEVSEENSARKEKLKKLREDRKAKIEVAKTRMKEQRKKIKAIKEQLKDSPLTVPAIAAATEIEPSHVLWFIAALKKYGQIIEGEKDGSYFQFRLAEKSSDERPR
jgi:predicted Rossmann fold nucleotide-binding protein DprA/Smf involved in DNA uptake